MAAKLTLTPAEASRFLGVHLNWIYQLLASGKLQGTRDGSRWVISLSALQEYKRNRQRSHRVTA